MDFPVFNMPWSLNSSRRRPNLPPKKYVKYNPFNLEKYTTKKDFSNIKMNNTMNNTINSVPKSVLANGNVLLNNGYVVDGELVKNSSLISNNNAKVVRTLPNGNSILSNGNTVNNNFASETNITPVNVTGGNVVMSNGNMVAAKNVKNLPSSPPNVTTTSKSFVETKEMMHSELDCPIAPPVKPTRYCRPQPFHATGGAKYFLVSDAYGSPTSG